MDAPEVEENVFAAGDAKLHGGMCRILSGIVCKVLAVFPVLEATRPRSKSGMQALCSLHVALEKSKSLLQHCSDCSKLYLAITGDSILVKFEKARCTLEESLMRVKDIVPQAIRRQILEIVTELEGTAFALDPVEKQVGEEVIMLLQQDKKENDNYNDINELETFHQAAVKLGISSSRAALAERRALKRLVERARIEEDRRKETIIFYLLHLMRKYSKIFRSEFSDDNSSQGSTPSSPAVQGLFENGNSPRGNGLAFDRQFSKLGSFNFKTNGGRSENIPIPPVEFRCPISLQLMYDPVIISSGQTYERTCVEKWFNDGHSTCPKSGQQLSHLFIIPNYCVKSLITSWCEQNGIPIPSGPPESPDLNYWILALSESEASNSRSMESIESCRPKGVKLVPSEDSNTIEKVKENEICNIDSSCHDQDNKDVFERYKTLLAILNEGENVRGQTKAAEEVRFLLKDDEEARIFMGGNGFVEALVRFLRNAIHEKNKNAQEIGAMALFNLAVNNNRNKEMVLSAGIIPLLEDMILKSNAYESATALYLNLTCLDEAKPIIGSTEAVPFLVRLLQADCETQCKLDALHALYNLSTHTPNVSRLLKCGVLDGLQALLMANGGPANYTWAEKSIAVLINIASCQHGKEEIKSTAGMVAELAAILSMGEPIEQEQAVSCLLNLCDGDDKCCQMVLQEGVIPSLVSLTGNGTTRGKEKGQKLLMLFREQRQREPSPVRVVQQIDFSSLSAAPEGKQPLHKKTLRKMGRRSWTTGWKKKHISVYQC